MSILDFSTLKAAPIKKLPLATNLVFCAIIKPNDASIIDAKQGFIDVTIAFGFAVLNCGWILIYCALGYFNQDGSGP